MNLYYCLFFGFYRAMEKTSYKDIAGYMSCVSFSMFLNINVLVFGKVIGYDFALGASSWTVASFIFMAILILNLIVFLPKGKYKHIVQKGLTKTRNCSYITVLYVIVSVAALVLVGQNRSDTTAKLN